MKQIHSDFYAITDYDLSTCSSERGEGCLRLTNDCIPSANHRLLSAEEEISLGKSIADSRLQISACLSRYPGMIRHFLDECESLIHGPVGITKLSTLMHSELQSDEDADNSGASLLLERYQSTLNTYESWKACQLSADEPAQRELLADAFIRACPSFHLLNILASSLLGQNRTISDAEDVIYHGLRSNLQLTQANALGYVDSLVRSGTPLIDLLKPQYGSDIGTQLSIQSLLPVENVLRCCMEQLGSDITDLASVCNTINRLIDKYIHARQSMINCNLRLVIKIARRYRNLGMDIEDLVQEGNIGLMRAVEKFDVERGYKFSTYAVWWIRQSITRALSDRGRVVRIPVHMGNKLTSYRIARSELEQRNGGDVSDAELCSALEMKKSDLDELSQLSLPVLSMDFTYPDQEDSPLINSFSDLSIDMTDNIHRERDLKLALDKLLGSLPDREALVICLRYGIGRDNPCTLKEAGEMLGISQERVRQLQARAESELRRAASEMGLSLDHIV